MTTIPSPRPISIRDERGFTLSELLVASVLTMIVTGAALTALQDAARVSETGGALTDVNQNLRVAMNLVIRDLLQAGDGIPTGGIPLPTGAGATTVVRPSPPGADWEFEETFLTLPAVSPGSNIGVLINNVATDAVTILYEDHRLEFNEAPVSAIAADGSSVTVPASIDISDDAVGIKTGDLIMLTGNMKNAIQEVTSVDGQVIYFQASADSKLNQPGAPAGSVLQLRDSLGNWGAVAIKRITMVSYYLYVPTSGPVTSHLVRRVNWGKDRVVAIGVENMQLTWDLVDGATNPANVENPIDPSPNQIRKANLYMSARSLEALSRTKDYMRASLSTQVSLRSLAYVNTYMEEQ